MVPLSFQKERIHRNNTERFSANILHFKAQQTYTTTDFAIARKQSLVTTLLYYKLSLHTVLRSESPSGKCTKLHTGGKQQ